MTLPYGFSVTAVSIHASVKDATKIDSITRQLVKVSIHASVKDATCIWPSVKLPSFGFNPRICKRCDTAGPEGVLRVVVSIHASVKDATPSCSLHIPICICFNPRICKRCDLPCFQMLLLSFCFNPRICKRCDCYYCQHCYC